MTQAEFEQASGHDLDGNLNLGANLLVGNGGSTGIAISSAGEVTMAAQPCVLAHNSVTDSNVTGNGGVATVDFDTEIFDQKADFATDTFTAPVTGRYLFTGNIRAKGNTGASTSVEVNIVASNRTVRHSVGATEVTETGSGFHAIVDMDASDTATITLTIAGEASDLIDIQGDGTALLAHISVLLVA